MKKNIDYIEKFYGIDKEIVNKADSIEEMLISNFRQVDKVKQYNQIKVIKAMQDCKLSDSHFNYATGYGYGDKGREILDEVYAKVFGSEDALVRHTIVSGTQALRLCLIGILRPGDELLSITGKPYDTLESVIGIRGNEAGSLKEFDISYSEIDLTCENTFDIKKILLSINEKTKLVYIQRSMGYSWRKPMYISEIENIVKVIKSINSNIIILVDNCYGEFVEEFEPTEVGADLIAGSLIKNPGGGIAPTGGYICGKKQLIGKIANMMTAPGLGKEIGPGLGNNRMIFQGMFLAPHVVAESIKGAMFAACFFKEYGFDVLPRFDSQRSDIIQAIKFDNKEMLIKFCEAIQKSSPVDSFVLPVPWAMPGYDSEVIMAAGTFTQGASIELSADAPVKEPYIAYMQGGLVFEQAKIAVMRAVQAIL